MKIVDLSHRLFHNMPTYPSDPDLKIQCEKDIKTHNTLVHSFRMGTHTGTHIDAPSHVLKEGKNLDDFDISHFMGETIKVDFQTYQKLDIDEQEVSGIIFDCNWEKNFNNPKKFYGSSRPEIPIDFIKALIRKDIKFFGCDLPSVDKSGSKNKLIHNTLLKNEILIYESLTNLNKIPSLLKFDFIGLPLKIKDIDGCPVRSLAIFS